MTGYPIPNLAGQFHRDEEIIRGSRFIVTMAHVTSHDEAHAFIDAVRSEFADATHNCWAYEGGAPESTAIIGASDDGEPKGTAGRPMLTVLQHCGVGEVAAVVTRYFGGTLLGTGGLVRAYQGLVKKGLETLPVKEKVATVTCEITCSHSLLGLVQKELRNADAVVRNRVFDADVHFEAEMPQDAFARFSSVLTDASGGRIGIRVPEKS